MDGRGVIRDYPQHEAELGSCHTFEGSPSSQQCGPPGGGSQLEPPLLLAKAKVQSPQGGAGGTASAAQQGAPWAQWPVPVSALPPGQPLLNSRSRSRPGLF